MSATSSIAENPMLPANIKALSSVDPELWSIKFFLIHAVQLDVLLQKQWRKILIIIVCSIKQYRWYQNSSFESLFRYSRLYTIKLLFYADFVGVVTSGHVTQMATTPFDQQTSRRYLLQSWSYCQSIFSYSHNAIFAHFCEE